MIFGFSPIIAHNCLDLLQPRDLTNFELIQKIQYLRQQLHQKLQQLKTVHFFNFLKLLYIFFKLDKNKVLNFLTFIKIVTKEHTYYRFIQMFRKIAPLLLFCQGNFYQNFLKFFEKLSEFVRERCPNLTGTNEIRCRNF
jgi:SPX domain protein involved in polyphosphate accumulation